MAEQYWAACQTMPGREHVIRADIEESGRGAFLPTLARTWVRDGKLCATEAPSVPGYVFFRVTRDDKRQEDWGVVCNIDGVHGVLVNDGKAMRVSSADMTRMVLGHATGEHNRLEARLSTDRKRNSSRKPRPGKRIRMRKNTVR
jgi:transcription antitermination factor NusG